MSIFSAPAIRFSNDVVLRAEVIATPAFADALNRLEAGLNGAIQAAQAGAVIGVAPLAEFVQTIKAVAAPDTFQAAERLVAGVARALNQRPAYIGFQDATAIVLDRMILQSPSLQLGNSPAGPGEAVRGAALKELPPTFSAVMALLGDRTALLGQTREEIEASGEVTGTLGLFEADLRDGSQVFFSGGRAIGVAHGDLTAWDNSGVRSLTLNHFPAPPFETTLVEGAGDGYTQQFRIAQAESR